MGTDKDNMVFLLISTLAGLGVRTSHTDSWPLVGSADMRARSRKVLRPFQTLPILSLVSLDLVGTNPVLAFQLLIIALPTHTQIPASTSLQRQVILHEGPSWPCPSKILASPGQFSLLCLLSRNLFVVRAALPFRSSAPSPIAWL